MWKLSIEDDQGQSTIVQLVRGEYSIGRTEENTIRLTERNISRHHARLRKQGPAWFLDDLGSYNGCYVNGGRVVEQQSVHPTDLIQLGDYRLELHADEADLLAANQAAPPRVDALSTTLNLSAQADRLVMVVGPTPGREYLLAPGPQRIGRGEECEICVNHSSVSRWHAELNFVGSSRYEVVDHNSSNGIRINGVELARGLLDSRDLLELGDVVLKFIPAGQVYRPSPEESRQLAALLGVDVEGPPPTKLERAGFIWKSMSRPTRWGTVILGLVVVVLFAVVLLNRQRDDGASISPEGSVAANGNQTALLLAKKQYDAKNVTLAHELVRTIERSAPELRDPAVARIEQAWASDVFTRAEQTAVASERLTLLESIEKTETLDGATRSKASDLIARTKAELTADASADKTQDAAAAASTPPVPAAEPTALLPSGTDAPTTEAAVAAKVDAPDADSLPKVAASPNGSSANAQAKRAVAKPASNNASAAAMVPTVASRQGASSGPAAVPTSAPVAKAAATPQEPNAADLATSGSIESSKAARDALKRKVAAGTAKESEKRLLRALCRQLGDSTCSR